MDRRELARAGVAVYITVRSILSCSVCQEKRWHVTSRSLAVPYKYKIPYPVTKRAPPPNTNKPPQTTTPMPVQGIRTVASSRVSLPQPDIPPTPISLARPPTKQRPPRRTASAPSSYNANASTSTTATGPAAHEA